MDSLVSANPTAGFSIVKMDATGTGSTATIGHGLSQAPVVIIGKPYNAGDNWRCGSTYLNSRNANAWTYNAILNTDVAEYQHTNVFDGTAPTATLVTMGSDGLNNGSYQSILYCFHAVEGYSKFGYYIGNGNANGAFIYTGFRPAFVMTKRLDSIRIESTPQNRLLFRETLFSSSCMKDCIGGVILYDETINQEFNSK